jgi:hypothetical protein
MSDASFTGNSPGAGVCWHGADVGGCMVEHLVLLPQMFIQLRP